MLPISLRGAQTHNLKSVDLQLQPGQLVALTGPSGAGKSSLAMDTLYAEGQRRFVESFSPYARQFLERLQRPPVEHLDPIAATVAVDRRAPVKSSRSTVATMADLEPYLSALFAAEAVPLCPSCNVPAIELSAAEATRRLLAQFDGQRVLVSYPLKRSSLLDPAALQRELLADGRRRVLLGGTVHELEGLDAQALTAADACVVVDRVAVSARERRRLQDALDQAMSQGGRAHVQLQPATKTA